MEFDTDAARQALEAAIGAEQASTTEGSVPSEGSTEQPESNQPGLFHGIDPNTLTPELRAMFDSMNSAYTQKTQALAARSKEIEAFGSLDEVKNAVEFVQALRDPDNLVEFHSELSEYLQSAGLTKAEADAAATKQIEQSRETEHDWDLTDPDTVALRKELEELKKQNEEFSSWKEQQEAERREQWVESVIARMETQIRQDNPHYSQDDIDTIYDMSYKYGGNLVAAQQAFEGLRQRFATEYLKSKTSVPSGLAPIAPTGGADKPQTFGNDFDAAHEYAKKYVKGLEAQGEL